MFPFVAGALTLLALYLLSVLYALGRNLINARKSNLPYIIIPWVDQNSFFWMVCSVALRPWLTRNMPRWIYDRLSLTIYGFEFKEKLRPFCQYAAPQGNRDTYVIVTPGKFEVNSRDPEFVTEILRRPVDFQQSDFVVLFMARFGHNLFIANGDDWARQRKVVASVINERVSKTVFHETIRHTEGLVEEVMKSGAAAETSGMFDMMKKITVNVLSGAGMGASVEWQDTETPKPGFKMTYIEAVKSILKGITGPLILPRWFLENYPAFLPGQQFLKQLSHAIDEFPVHTWDLLDKERERMDTAGGQTRSNIMSQLLQASEHGDGGKKGAKALSDDELKGNLFIFTAAGFDTTANTLSYALVLLARYPQWQPWLFAEIDDIIPKDGEELDYATIFPKATRVLAFMYETLRLFPPLIHLAKQTRAPQTVRTSRGTYLIPAGSTVYANSVGVHLESTVWRNLNLAEGEKESDSDEYAFRPTRWFNPPGKSHAIFQPPKGSFVPWSSGPRVCPGQKMAQVEFVACVLKLLNNHKIEAVALPVEGGELESVAQVADRLDHRMQDSFPILTLQMDGIYEAENDAGLKLRLSTRA